MIIRLFSVFCLHLICERDQPCKSKSMKSSLDLPNYGVRQPFKIDKVLHEHNKAYSYNKLTAIYDDTLLN